MHPSPRRWLALALLLSAAAAAGGPAICASRPAERARHAMVAGPEPLAVEVGLEVLRQGGNAVDAAVAIAFALAVTHPQAGNIGGGGFMLIRLSSGRSEFIDYRETAPAASARDMFLDERGEAIAGASLRTYRAVGVPGTVAGLALAKERFGTLPWKRLLSPAIKLAREGFPVRRDLERDLLSEEDRLAAWPATQSIFFRGGHPLAEGDLLVQKDLARTLETLARDGEEAFYRGALARALEQEMASHSGLITGEDLAAYKPIVREPLKETYRGYEIITSPPPSSGGVALFEMLHMLEPFDLKSLGHNSSAYIHVASEAMKRAFADRARFMGDPGFVRMPLAGLLSRDYAASLMRSFDPLRATPAPSAGPGDPLSFEKPSTTHFSVMDSSGAVVANTYTLNDSFGCGAVAGGLGFLLNNEMDDFSIKPGVPNLYGLVGGEANSIMPGKRMLSSMTPTIVVKDGRPFMALGTPGGPTILTSVLQVLLNVVEFGLDPQAAVDAPRFHHQWLPDRIVLERDGFSADVREALKHRGHDLLEAAPRGDVQAILVDERSRWILGASDARGFGMARGQ